MPIFQQGMVGFTIDDFVALVRSAVSEPSQDRRRRHRGQDLAGARKTLADPRLRSLSIELEANRVEYTRGDRSSRSKPPGSSLFAKARAEMFDGGRYRRHLQLSSFAVIATASRAAMIVAILIGREGSTGFPGKNVMNRARQAAGRLAARGGARGPRNRAHLCVDRQPAASRRSPSSMARASSTGRRICAPRRRSASTPISMRTRSSPPSSPRRASKPELYVLLMANAPTVSAAQLSEGIAALRAQSGLRFGRHGFLLQHVEPVARA